MTAHFMKGRNVTLPSAMDDECKPTLSITDGYMREKTKKSTEIVSSEQKVEINYQSVN